MSRFTRRECIALFGGAAVTRSRPAHSAELERMRHIGVLVSSSADDPLSQMLVGAFSQGLREYGWILGRNLLIEYRWAATDDDRLRQYATELVGLAPNVILAFGGTAARALRRQTSVLPVIFVNTSDPVASGLVGSLARPEGNMTGFLSIEYGMSVKWLGLLKHIAPRVTRAAVIRDPASVAGTEQFDVIQGAASSLGVEVSPIDARDNRTIEHGITKFVRRSNGGLIVTTSRTARHHRDLIIALAKQYELPSVYPNDYYVTAGGLVSYGANLIEQLRQSAGYVDRIIKGEKPADLPVLPPTKYELAVNLKTAKALRLDIPSTLLARADEVIE